MHIRVRLADSSPRVRVSFFLICCIASIARLDAQTIRVTPEASLTEALLQARDGSRVIVAGGVHRDTPYVIRASIELVGEDGAVLDAGGHGMVLRVEANGVTVRGLTLRNAGVSQIADNAAVLVESVSDCRIENNTLEENFFGIYLAATEGCVVEGNRLTASGTREVTSGNGIHLWNTTSTVLRGNDVQGHRDGFYLEFAREVRLEQNHSEGNLRYGLHFMFSDDSIYERNTFRSNGAGVAVMYSRRIRMAENTFIDNRGAAAYGLLLKDVTDGEVVANRFLNNTTALMADGADRMEIRGNRFFGNGWAIRVRASSQESRFTANDFIENAFDVVTNSRHTANLFEGNYWSRYRGYDRTGDGFGDVPHRPVRFFAVLAERHPVALMLLRSPVADVLDLAERVLPVLTPAELMDRRPRMREMSRK